MDQYEAINVWTLVPKPKGVKILRTVWAYKIKTTGTGTFDKLSVRVCAVGTGMDRDIYAAYSDVMRMSSLKIIIAIRAGYYALLVDFQGDLVDAFQTTRTDGSVPEIEDEEYIYIYLPKGFEKYGPNGQELFGRLNSALQGRIDSARKLSTAAHNLLVHPKHGVGLTRSVWDPKVYIYHHGPLAGTAASLDDILRAYANCEQPASPASPIGWSVIGLHVDDIVGTATSVHVRDHILGLLGQSYGVKCARWGKVLGFKVTCDDEDETVAVSAESSLAALQAKHLDHRVTITPKHPCPSKLELDSLELPAQGDPAREKILEMQTETRSIFGQLLWLANVYPIIQYATTRGCEFVANPDWSVHKLGLHISMHIVAHHQPLVFGGKQCTSLILANPTIKPFTAGAKEYGLHAFADGALVPKSITGGTLMLAGASILDICQRQHLAAPDSHSNEIVAATTVLHSCVPIRGLLQECSVHQDRPTPFYVDSGSAVAAAQNRSAPKRSIWLQRRTLVFHEGVEQKEIEPTHISERDNVSDPNTKYLTYDVTKRHHHYKCNAAGDPPGCNS